MKTLKHFLLFGTLLLAACQGGGNAERPLIEPPEDLIPEKEFVKLLYEINRLEGARSSNTIQKKKIPIQAYYSTLFQDHSVSPEQFETSFDYYHSKPEQIAIYYQWVIDSLRVDEQASNAPKKLK